MPLLRRSWTRRPGRRAAVRSTYGLRSSRRRFRMTRSPGSLVQPRLVTSAPLRAVHFHTKSQTIGAVANAEGVLLNAPPRGQSITNRTGNRIKMMSLIVNGGFVMNTFGANASGTVTPDKRWQFEQQCSLLLFYVPAPVVTSPSLTDYFAPFSSNGRIDTWSLRRISEIPSMRLLKRINVVLKTDNVGASSVTLPIRSIPPAKPISFKVNLDHLTSFANEETSSFAGGINGGALYLYVLGDYNPSDSGSPALSQVPTFMMETRLAFTNVD